MKKLVAFILCMALVIYHMRGMLCSVQRHCENV